MWNITQDDTAFVKAYDGMTMASIGARRTQLRRNRYFGRRSMSSYESNATYANAISMCDHEMQDLFRTKQ